MRKREKNEKKIIKKGWDHTNKNALDLIKRGAHLP